MNVENTYDLDYVGNYAKDMIKSPFDVKYVDGDGNNNSANDADRVDESAIVIADNNVKISLRKMS